MQCSVDGCERESSYKAANLCQKHYFRIRRSGSTELQEKNRKLRYVTTGGYISLYMPDHPLANKGNVVFEHRVVMWPIVGEGCRPCEICGKPQTWKTCHVDHIDENRQNNDPSNLRILCRGCNVKRGFSVQSYANSGEMGLVEFDGKIDTPTGWSRDPRVSVAGNTIVLRLKAGMTAEQALFGPKKTHNGNPKIDRRPKKTQYKHERKNSIPVTIGGVTLTAAEWAREPGVTVTEASVINRTRSGWGAVDAVFTPPRGCKPSAEQSEAITKEYRAKVKELKKAQDHV